MLASVRHFTSLSPGKLKRARERSSASVLVTPVGGFAHRGHADRTPGQADEKMRVDVEEGLTHPSVVNCDQLTRLEKSVLTDYIGMLSSKKLGELRTALRVALSVD